MRLPRIPAPLFDTFVLVPSAGALLWLLEHLDLLADVHAGVLIGLLLLAHGLGHLSSQFTSWWPSNRLAIHARLAVQCVTAAAILYATGWGAVMAVALLLVVQSAITDRGSTVWAPSTLWALGAVLGGQLAVAAGIAPTMIDVPVVHGVAALNGLALAFVCRLIGSAAGAQERARQELARSERRFRSLVQNSYDAISVVDQSATSVLVTPASERILGYSPEEAVATNVFEHIHDDDQPAAAELFRGLFDRPGGAATAEFRVRHRDGTWRWVEFAATNLLHDPDVEGIVVNWRDITERKLLAERLAFDAAHDPLTGLANRASFTDALERAVARAARTGTSLAVMFLDLDGFKAVNDAGGHHVGDALLVETARRVAAAVRPGDVVARLGGDEFTVLLDPVGGLDDAARVADRLLYGDEPVAASIGIAVGNGYSEPGALLREADLAMYVAKRAGRGCWETVDAEFGSASHRG